MSELDTQCNENRNPAKINDFVKLLHSLETICELTQKNAPIIYFMKEMRAVLQEYGNLNANDFMIALKRALSEITPKRKKGKKGRQIEEIDIENISLPMLETLLSNGNLTKEQLLNIGKIRFGILKGAHKKLTKVQLRGLIESTIANIKTLHTIEQKASE